MSKQNRMIIGKDGKPTTDWTSIDTPVQHIGHTITLPASPEPMPYEVGIETLQRVMEQENQKFDTHEHIKGAPWDALVAVFKALQERFGVVLSQSQKSFSGDILPDMVTVRTGHNALDAIQVPMGQMGLPNVQDPVTVMMRPDGVIIAGKVRKRDRAILVEVAAIARRILQQDSIYRGKAIRLGVDNDGALEISTQPEFINLTQVLESDMIHSADTADQIRTNILAPLKHTAACRKNRIPLKRGILLEGPYGTGKSLTARVTAKVATDNGWTFIMLNRSQGLKAAIELARTYQPCVIFAEDIDRAADREDESVNDLVNMLDGILTKDMEMMVVLTTNFVEKIDRSLLRPGRFDAIVSIHLPDAAAAAQLVRHYSRDLLAADADLTEVGEAIQGWIPATIREVVERAKLSMLTEDRTNISEGDLITAARGMQRHMELLNPKVETETPADRLFKALSGVVQSAFTGGEGDELATAEALQGVAVTAARSERRIQNLAAEQNQQGRIIKGAANSAEEAKENSQRVLLRMGG